MQWCFCIYLNFVWNGRATWLREINLMKEDLVKAENFLLITRCWSMRRSRSLERFVIRVWQQDQEDLFTYVIITLKRGRWVLIADVGRTVVRCTCKILKNFCAHRQSWFLKKMGCSAVVHLTVQYSNGNWQLEHQNRLNTDRKLRENLFRMKFFVSSSFFKISKIFKSSWPPCVRRLGDIL